MARYAKEVVVCYDSDEPGQKAASRAIPILRGAGLLVRVFAVPDGKDPDEYIKTHGPVKFRQLLDACGNDVEYRLGKLRAGCRMQNAEGRVAFLNGAAKLLATLDNRIEQEVYAAKLAAEIGVETSAVMLQVDRFGRQIDKNRQQKEFRVIQQKSAGVNDSINPEKSRHLRAAGAEEALIAYLLKFPENAGKINGAVPPEKFVTAFNRRVYGIIMGRIMEGKAADLTSISENFSMDEMSYLSRILAKFNDISPTMQDAMEYAGVIQQENDKIRFSAAAPESPQGGDIREYLRKLRQQKK
jgi:DNA primase